MQSTVLHAVELQGNRSGMATTLSNKTTSARATARYTSIVRPILDAAIDLCQGSEELRFGEPVACVYNPLTYAWASHKRYVERFAGGPKQAVFMGMNPGPWGMAQTGVPFGEVAMVRDWLGIHERIDRPPMEHAKRPIEGFACTRSEVSGRRIWGLFQDRFTSASRFFRNHYVANYCPLVFMETSGRNRTPDKLPVAEAAPLYAICDHHLVRVVELLKPRWLIAVGAFAHRRAAEALHGHDVQIARILHPSPANPAAHRDWAGQVTSELQRLGIW